MTTETRFHAHVESESRDCDGRYSGRWTVGLDNNFDGREDIINYLNEFYVYESGQVEAGNDADGRYGWESHEPTEEGYRSVWVTYCTDAHCTSESEARDHSAEAAGY